MATKQRRLTNLKVNEVSLVDDGANQLADIVLAKRNEVDAAANPEEETTMAEEKTVETTKAAEPVDINKAIEAALAKERADFQKQLDAEKANVAKAQADAAQAKADADIAKAAVEVEKDKRETLEFSKRAETELPNLPGASVEKGLVLKAIEGLPDAIKVSALAMLKAGDTAMAKSFTVIGKSGTGTAGSATEKLETLAKERAAERKISLAKAKDQILTEQPELYTESRAEEREMRRAS